MGQVGKKLERVRTLLNRGGAALLRVAILALLAWCAHEKVSGIFGPTDRNHLVVINMSGRAFSSPVKVALEGDTDWKSSFPGGVGESHGTLVIYNIPASFSRGTVTIVAGDDQVIARREIVPPGRYCGSLVVSILPNGEATHKFNAVPD